MKLFVPRAEWIRYFQSTLLLQRSSAIRTWSHRYVSFFEKLHFFQIFTFTLKCKKWLKQRIKPHFNKVWHLRWKVGEKKALYLPYGLNSWISWLESGFSLLCEFVLVGMVLSVAEHLKSLPVIQSTWNWNLFCVVHPFPLPPPSLLPGSPPV